MEVSQELIMNLTTENVNFLIVFSAFYESHILVIYLSYLKQVVNRQIEIPIS